MENRELAEIFRTGKNEHWFEECRRIFAEIYPEMNLDFLEQVHDDVRDIFLGQYPGFQVSLSKYHNFYHTCSTGLAVARLFHGLILEGETISRTTLEQGVVSALFHDIGWLPRKNSPEQSDEELHGKHEERSIRFMTQYLQQKGCSSDYCDACGVMIQCTNLTVQPETLAFKDDANRLGGYVVGSADILALMADRCYLEKLPFLYREQQYSKQFKFETPFELLQRTAEFYSITVMERLEITFNNVYKAMRSHFRKRWQLNEDLYSENILKNLDYLKKVISECENEFWCVEKKLRRDITR